MELSLSNPMENLLVTLKPILEKYCVDNIIDQYGTDKFGLKHYDIINAFDAISIAEGSDRLCDYVSKEIDRHISTDDNLILDNLNKIGDDLSKQLTAFDTLQLMLDAEGNYFPSIPINMSSQHLALADIYNYNQILRGDKRRAYTGKGYYNEGQHAYTMAENEYIVVKAGMYIATSKKNSIYGDYYSKRGHIIGCSIEEAKCIASIEQLNLIMDYRDDPINKITK